MIFFPPFRATKGQLHRLTIKWEEKRRIATPTKKRKWKSSRIIWSLPLTFLYILKEEKSINNCLHFSLIWWASCSWVERNDDDDDDDAEEMLPYLKWRQTKRERTEVGTQGMGRFDLFFSSSRSKYDSKKKITSKTDCQTGDVLSLLNISLR